MRSDRLANKVETIEERNFRVEIDKEWETSITRRCLIASGTYLILGFYLSFWGIQDSWLHALVPTGGYLISTLSLLYAKKLWIKIKFSEKNNNLQ